MHSFDARLEPRLFWLAVLVPPLVFWIVVEGGVKVGLGGQISFNGVLALTALAYGLPLGALAWVICSVAAYTITPGRLTVHRVVGDREYSLDGLLEPAREQRGEVLLRWPGRTLHLRTARSPELLHALVQAGAPGAGR